MLSKLMLAQVTTDSKSLHELATDGDVFVRCAVAHNSNTSPETLKLLSTYESSWVRNAVAQNKNCPLDAYKYVQGLKILENKDFS